MWCEVPSPQSWEGPGLGGHGACGDGVWAAGRAAFLSTGKGPSFPGPQAFPATQAVLSAWTPTPHFPVLAGQRRPCSEKRPGPFGPTPLRTGLGRLPPPPVGSPVVTVRGEGGGGQHHVVRASGSGLGSPPEALGAAIWPPSGLCRLCGVRGSAEWARRHLALPLPQASLCQAPVPARLQAPQCPSPCP